MKRKLHAAIAHRRETKQHVAIVYLRGNTKEKGLLAKHITVID